LVLLNEGIYEEAVEMVSQGMMPLQCFVKTDTNIQVAL
jgi:hypothetical protein